MKTLLILLIAASAYGADTLDVRKLKPENISITSPEFRKGISEKRQKTSAPKRAKITDAEMKEAKRWVYNDSLLQRAEMKKQAKEFRKWRKGK